MGERGIEPMRTEFEIKQGDALAVLRTLEAESVQCCVTSPPYYGLRSYKTVPQIWDGDEFCDHEFTTTAAKLLNANRNGKGSVTLEGGSGEYRQALHGHDVGQAGFCSNCGAWRGELGLEPTFQLYIAHLLQIFAEVRRVLKKDGCCFVNLGDSFAGSGKGIGDKNGHGKSVFTDDHIEKTDWSQIDIRAKSLMNIPHRFFIGMTDELRMIQRNNINWWKRACMPSSATDRWTVDFESIGFFTKNARYKFNQQKERTLTFDVSVRNRDIGKLNNTPGKTRSAGLKTNAYEYKNQRTTWDISFEPQSHDHYASYPTKLVERMILASTDEGDTVLDIFTGTGTTLLTALRHKRNALGIELQPDYIKIAEKRLKEVSVKLF